MDLGHTPVLDIRDRISLDPLEAELAKIVWKMEKKANPDGFPYATELLR
jgi:hypothetical protein